MEKKPKKKPVSCSECGSNALRVSYQHGGIPLCRRHLGDDLILKEQRARGLAGRRGVFLPKSIVDRYEEAIVDPELVSLREDIATAEARCMQLLEQIRDDPRNSGAYAQLLERNIENQIESVRKGSLTYAQLVQNVLVLLRSPVQEKLSWAEYYQVSDLKRKLVDSEAKRLSTLGWTPDAVMGMIAEIAEILKPLLTDDNMRIFLDAMASSKTFSNQNFQLVPQVNLGHRMLTEKPEEIEAELEKMAFEAEEIADNQYEVTA